MIAYTIGHERNYDAALPDGNGFFVVHSGFPCMVLVHAPSQGSSDDIEAG